MKISNLEHRGARDDGKTALPLTPGFMPSAMNGKSPSLPLVYIAWTGWVHNIGKKTKERVCVEL